MNKQASFRERFATKLFGDVIQSKVDLATKTLDSEWRALTDRNAAPLDVPWYERQTTLEDALEAWRVNPLARRIVSLTTDYVVGGGVAVESKYQYVNDWITRFWNHPQNKMNVRLTGWCDELTRAGELFPVLSTNVDGMSFVRAVPARLIDYISTAENDYERELLYHQAAWAGIGGIDWQAWNGASLDKQAALHLAINRPVGAVRGAGDLDAILIWLKRYKAWQEARLALNLHSSAFVWDVTLKNANADAVKKRRSELSHAPASGSINVHDESETWTVLRPSVAGWDASADGRTLLQTIAAGANTPPAWLAQWDDGSRATAATMSSPSLRHYQLRREQFGSFVLDVVYAALEQARVRGGLTHRGQRIERPISREEYGLTVKFAELDKGDNLQLAQSAAQIISGFGQLHDKGLMSDADYVDMAYRFAGELVDVDAALERAKSDQNK